MSEEILQIDANLIIDESIEKYEVHEYTPESGTTNLNSGGEIRIVIQSQDLYTHPSESYLVIEGRLVKTDGSSYVDADLIALSNNGLMHMFQNIRYELSGQEIENVNNPGQATTMIGLLKYSDIYETSALNFMWCKDDTNNADLKMNTGFNIRHNILIEEPNPKGTFSFRIPLKHIFGFADDYNKVIYGFKHQLTLTRKLDHDAIFKAATVADGKIILDKLSWFVPHVEPSFEQKERLYTLIQSKIAFNVGYRFRQCDSIYVPETTHFSWRLSVKSSSESPRWIIIGFQTNKQLDQDKNASVFDHIDLKNIYVTLNSRRYPAVDYNLNFPKQQFSRVYGAAEEFLSKFYGIESSWNVSTKHYKHLYPLFVFDVSKQSERLKYSTTDIQVKATFNTNVPAKTEAYAIVISDKIIKFQSDGNKMAVVVG